MSTIRQDLSFLSRTGHPGQTLTSVQQVTEIPQYSRLSRVTYTLKGIPPPTVGAVEGGSLGYSKHRNFSATSPPPDHPTTRVPKELRP